MSAESRNVLTEAQCAAYGFGPAHPMYAEIYDVTTGEPLDPLGLMEMLKRMVACRVDGDAAMEALAEITQ